MTDARRDEINTRIAAARARDALLRPDRLNAGAADDGPAPHASSQFTTDRTVADQPGTVRSLAGKAIGFAKAHPFVTIAGALGLGLAIASLMPAPRRAAVATATRAAPRVLRLATILAEIALTVSRQVRDQAQEHWRDAEQRQAEAGVTPARGWRAGSMKGSASPQRPGGRELGKAIVQRLRERRGRG